MIRKISILLIIVLIAMLGACKFDVPDLSPTPSVTEPPVSETPMDGDPTETPTSSPEETPISPEPDYLFAEIKDTVFEKEYNLEGTNEEIVGELYIAIPEIALDEYQENAERINEYFEMLKDKYREDFEYDLTMLAEEDLYGHGARRLLDLAFSTEYNKDGIVSFLFTVASYQGGAHGNVAIMSETFDLRDGTRITADTLFTADEEEYTSRIKQYILAEMDDNAKNNDSLYFDNYAELLEATYDKEAFVLTEDSLHVYFQVYDLAPYAGGSIQFDIPYEYLKDILNPRYGLVQ